MNEGGRCGSVRYSPYFFTREVYLALWKNAEVDLSLTSRNTFAETDQVLVDQSKGSVTLCNSKNSIEEVDSYLFHSLCGQDSLEQCRKKWVAGVWMWFVIGALDDVADVSDSR